MGLLSLISCNTEKNTYELQTGDILFRESVSAKLSQAIDEVTQTDSATHFSHMGLVELNGKEASILHANPSGGTCRISLHEFCNPKEDTVRVVIYRLKNQFKASIPNAINIAKNMLGKPYNYSYILSNDSHYCSDFVYKAFEKDSIFEMNPMTFISPETGEFSKTWEDYYQKLKLAIPEGLMGCNPNGMAASQKLDLIGDLKLND